MVVYDPTTHISIIILMPSSEDSTSGLEMLCRLTVAGSIKMRNHGEGAKMGWKEAYPRQIFSDGKSAKNRCGMLLTALRRRHDPSLFASPGLGPTWHTAYCFCMPIVVPVNQRSGLLNAGYSRAPCARPQRHIQASSLSESETYGAL